MSIFSFFRKKQQFQYNPNEAVQEVVESAEYSSMNVNDLEFVDTSNSIFATVPIQLAKDVPVVTRKIVEDKGNKFTFPLCPGMWDFSRMGYILPAWTDFHIKSNKAGVAVVVGGGGKPTPFMTPFSMDTSISDGLIEYKGVSDNVYNFASPWRVFSNTKNISCLLLPAWYHTKKEILDNLYFYPGVVDYDRFRALNVIVSVMNKCTLTIKAGEPLLHIIPFFNERIVCGYGPPTPAQSAETNYDPVTHTNHFYRKKQQVKKDYKLNEPENNEE